MKIVRICTTGKEANDEFGDRRNQNLGISITDLPNPIAIDILVRLSVKRIFTCKRVCKTWRNLISTPEFAKLHFARGGAFPLIRSLAPSRVSRTLYLVEPPELCSGFDRMSDRAIKMKLDTKLKIPLHSEELVINSFGYVNLNPCPKSGLKLWAEDHELNVVNSCNGLLCLSEPFKHDDPFFRAHHPVIVCNPITSEYINLPAAMVYEKSDIDGIFIHCCGLGFSPKTNQYKVMRNCRYFSKEEKHGTMTEIHTLGTGSWKRIGNAPPTVYGIAPGGFVKCGGLGSPTYLNGSLHWLCLGDKDSEYSECIMSFDFDDEKFQSLPPPPFKFSNTSPDRNHEMALGELRGRLCICYVSSFEQPKVWVMKEYGVQGSWREEYCFSTQANVGRQIDGIYEPISLLRNGAILLFHPLMGALIYHDPKKPGFIFLKLTRKGYKSSYEAIAHIPSFISLKDAVKGDDLAVLSTKSRCAEFKLWGESKELLLVEEDPAMTSF